MNPILLSNALALPGGNGTLLANLQQCIATGDLANNPCCDHNLDRLVTE